MLEFQEKRKIKRLIYSRIVLVILLLIIVVLLNAVFGVYKKQSITRDNLDKTKTSLESLRAREKMLSSEIERLKTETGVEQEIREKYGLVKPGEEVIVVLDDDSSTESDSGISELTFWQKVMDWLK